MMRVHQVLKPRCPLGAAYPPSGSGNADEVPFGGSSKTRRHGLSARMGTPIVMVLDFLRMGNVARKLARHNRAPVRETTVRKTAQAG